MAHQPIKTTFNAHESNKSSYNSQLKLTYTNPKAIENFESGEND